MNDSSLINHPPVRNGAEKITFLLQRRKKSGRM
jgi:hypothetical protein